MGKFDSDLPVVTEMLLGADTIILIALFYTFSIRNKIESFVCLSGNSSNVY